MVQNQIHVLSVPIDVVTMTEAVQKVLTLVGEPGLHMVATANAEMVMMAQENKKLLEVLQKADLVVPDGAGVLWAAEQQGESFPERVTGCDLLHHLLQAAKDNNIKVYCLGGAEGVVEQALENATAELGDLPVVGYHSGYFTEEEEVEILKDIERSGAQLVFVAFGVPKQEFWIRDRLAHLEGVVAMGVGGSFDVMAGMLKRAPLWMQRNRLEWLYRLLLQPKRIIRMLALPKFMWAVWRHKQ